MCVCVCVFSHLGFNWGHLIWLWLEHHLRVLQYGWERREISSDHNYYIHRGTQIFCTCKQICRIGSQVHKRRTHLHKWLNPYVATLKHTLTQRNKNCMPSCCHMRGTLHVKVFQGKIPLTRKNTHTHQLKSWFAVGRTGTNVPWKRSSHNLLVIMLPGALNVFVFHPAEPNDSGVQHWSTERSRLSWS